MFSIREKGGSITFGSFESKSLAKAFMREKNYSARYFEIVKVQGGVITPA